MTEPSAPRTPYQYSNLGSDQIRLFRVISTDDIVQLQIEHVSLHHAPSYHALSYVWGDEEPDVEILLHDGFQVGERSFYVTPHLAAGIRKVAMVLVVTGKQQDGYIWVDAICINQADLSEKGTQIPLMGSIYTNASMVCVWLGEASQDALLSINILLWLANQEIKTSSQEEADLAVTSLEHILIELGVEMEDLRGLANVINALQAHASDGNNRLKARLESMSSEQPILKPDHPIWSALLTFFSHPWFSRIWTLQEIYLAQQAWVMSNRLAIPWEYCSKIRSLLIHRRCIRGVYSVKSATKARFGNILHHHLEIQTSSKLDGKPLHLGTLLLGLGRRHARVRKDYIYGILGLVDDSIRHRIPIDYSTSTATATVFAQATRLTCESVEEHLSPTHYWSQLMMDYGRRKKKVEGLPSWCPDFSNTELDVVIVGCLPLNSKALSEMYKPYIWMEFPIGTNTLIISGFRLDRVDAVVPAAEVLSLPEVYAIQDPFTDIDDSTFRRIFCAKQLQWLHDMESVFAAHATDTAITEGWLRRFVFEELSGEHLNKVESFKIGPWIMKKLCAFVVANGITSVAKLCAEGGMTEFELRLWFVHVILILTYQCGRHMFRTSSGRMGHSPLPVSPGDNICFIPGGIMLHVLSQDCTKHVATATVEGFMGDDLLKIGPTDKSQWDLFYLS